MDESPKVTASERSQTPPQENPQKDPHIIWFHLYEIYRKGESVEIESGFVTAKGWRWERGMAANGHKVSFGMMGLF